MPNDPSPATVERVMKAIVEEGDRLRARGLLGTLDGTVYANFADVAVRAAIAAMEEDAPVDESEAALWDKIDWRVPLGSALLKREFHSDIEALIAHREKRLRDALERAVDRWELVTRAYLHASGLSDDEADEVVATERAALSEQETPRG